MYFKLKYIPLKHLGQIILEQFMSYVCPFGQNWFGYFNAFSERSPRKVKVTKQQTSDKYFKKLPKIMI